MARVSASPDELWRVEDFARWARIPIASVYYQISRGRIPGVVRLGNTIRIDPEVAIPALRAGVDVEGARGYLRAHLPDDEPIEAAEPAVLDAAARVVAGAKP